MCQQRDGAGIKQGINIRTENWTNCTDQAIHELLSIGEPHYKPFFTRYLVLSSKCPPLSFE